MSLNIDILVEKNIIYINFIYITILINISILR